MVVVLRFAVIQILCLSNVVNLQHTAPHRTAQRFTHALHMLLLVFTYKNRMRIVNQQEPSSIAHTHFQAAKLPTHHRSPCPCPLPLTSYHCTESSERLAYASSHTLIHFYCIFTMPMSLFSCVPFVGAPFSPTTHCPSLVIFSSSFFCFFFIYSDFISSSSMSMLTSLSSSSSSSFFPSFVSTRCAINIYIYSIRRECLLSVCVCMCVCVVCTQSIFLLHIIWPTWKHLAIFLLRIRTLNIESDREIKNKRNVEWFAEAMNSQGSILVDEYENSSGQHLMKKKGIQSKRENVQFVLLISMLIDCIRFLWIMIFSAFSFRLFVYCCLLLWQLHHCACVCAWLHFSFECIIRKIIQFPVDFSTTNTHIKHNWKASCDVQSGICQS